MAEIILAVPFDLMRPGRQIRMHQRRHLLAKNIEDAQFDLSPSPQRELDGRPGIERIGPILLPSSAG